MLIVDRIEGDLAVVEVDANTFENVPVEDISGEVRAGAVLHEIGPGEYAVDEGETATRTKRIQKKARQLFR